MRPLAELRAGGGEGLRDGLSRECFGAASAAGRRGATLPSFDRWEPQPMSDGAVQITNLLYRCAELMGAGEFDGAAAFS